MHVEELEQRKTGPVHVHYLDSSGKATILQVSHITSRGVPIYMLAGNLSRACRIPSPPPLLSSLLSCLLPSSLLSALSKGHDDDSTGS